MLERKNKKEWVSGHAITGKRIKKKSIESGNFLWFHRRNFTYDFELVIEAVFKYILKGLAFFRIMESIVLSIFLVNC
jgi:hypothetical protein